MTVEPICAIGIDLGGTRIKGVLVDGHRNILFRQYTPTRDAEGSWQEGVMTTFRALQQKMPSAALLAGISAPGLPNRDNTAIAFMPGRLAGLENFSWRDWLQVPAWVLNDAVAALTAEAASGAARQAVNAILVTLGTGVGGALLIDGKPFQGSFQKAGHIGHIVVDSDRDPDLTGMPGSLEDCIGNCSIEKRSNGKFQSTETLLAACRSGDTFAREVWLTAVRKLAIALASASNLISPDTIVVGGGIAQAGEDLFVPLNRWFDKYEWQPGGIRPRIVRAVHGDLAGALGAACFALDRHGM